MNQFTYWTYLRMQKGTLCIQTFVCHDKHVPRFDINIKTKEKIMSLNLACCFSTACVPPNEVKWSIVKSDSSQNWASLVNCFIFQSGGIYKFLHCLQIFSYVCINQPNTITQRKPGWNRILFFTIFSYEVNTHVRC